MRRLLDGVECVMECTRLYVYVRLSRSHYVCVDVMLRVVLAEMDKWQPNGRVDRLQAICERRNNRKAVSTFNYNNVSHVLQ